MARASWASRSGLVSPRMPGSAEYWPAAGADTDTDAHTDADPDTDTDAATIRAARFSARRAASATEVSSCLRSAPRSHSVGAGCGPRLRRAARAASSVVRPLPGRPTRPSTEARLSAKALNSLAVEARSTGATAPAPPAPSRPTWPAGAPAGPSCPTDVAVSSSTPARLRSAPYAGTVAAFSASSSASAPSDGTPVTPAHARPPACGSSGTAKTASRWPDCSAAPRTPTTAPVPASSTGPPAAPPPSLNASRPAVPIANSRAPSRRWRRSVAVYVTATAPSTLASRQPPAAIRTYAPVSICSRTVTGNGSTPSPAVRTRARSRAGNRVTAVVSTTQLRSPSAEYRTSPAEPSTTSWLVTTVPWWSATNPRPRGGRPRRECGPGLRHGGGRPARHRPGVRRSRTRCRPGLVCRCPSRSGRCRASRPRCSRDPMPPPGPERRAPDACPTRLPPSASPPQSGGRRPPPGLVPPSSNLPAVRPHAHAPTPCFFDGRREVISGKDRSANAPPSAPSVHSERLHGRVNRQGSLDTP